jgi:predicted PhzF superfamily epimerase YddE/YHI9
MKLPFYWVDAFTDKVASGNPAGVVPVQAWPADAVMQMIAFENGLAETAFFVRSGTDRYHLRWFTPAAEIDLCGHATLATGHVLFNELGQTGDLVTFDTHSGPLTVRRREQGLLELDFPARPAAAMPTPPGILRGLGATPGFVGKARDYLCVFDTEEQVRALRPDMAELAALDALGIIATAPGRECDFVSRFFAPRVGVPEDPVTGSSHCTLVPYWARRLGKNKLHARQVSPRGGELICALVGERVLMAGRAVSYLRGEISI